ncbi:unnamed protein product, partial [Lampetra fluviatilis]
SGLVFSDEEWEREWEELLQLASSEPRGSSLSAPRGEGEDPVYESLEEFHVFALTHVLKRPIIVIADTVLRDSGGEAFAPIPFGGVYLPVEIPSSRCHRTPLVLAYDQAHFSALVSTETRRHGDTETRPGAQDALVPLTDALHELLPLHFAVDPGGSWDGDISSCRCVSHCVLSLSLEQRLELLHSYMDVVCVPYPDEGQATSESPSASPDPPAPPPPPPTSSCSSSSSSSSADVNATDTVTAVTAASSRPNASTSAGSSPASSSSSSSSSTTNGTTDTAAPPPPPSSSSKPRTSKSSGKRGTGTGAVTGTDRSGGSVVSAGDSVASKLGHLGRTIGHRLRRNVGGLMHGAGKTGGTGVGNNAGAGKTTTASRKHRGNEPPVATPVPVQVGTGVATTGATTTGATTEEVRLSLAILRASAQGERKFLLAASLSGGGQAPIPRRDDPQLRGGRTAALQRRPSAASAASSAAPSRPLFAAALSGGRGAKVARRRRCWRSRRGRRGRLRPSVRVARPAATAVVPDDVALLPLRRDVGEAVVRGAARRNCPSVLCGPPLSQARLRHASKKLRPWPPSPTGRRRTPGLSRCLPCHTKRASERAAPPSSHSGGWRAFALCHSTAAAKLLPTGTRPLKDIAGARRRAHAASFASKRSPSS